MNNIRPAINVTPLIDVLLVLLIIFMVVSPGKPTDFKMKIPREPKSDDAQANPDTLIVAVNSDSSLRLNKNEEFGTIDAPEKLVEKLSAVFRERARNRVYSQNAEFRTDLTEAEKIERTVFIKAPRLLGYGRVVKVVDAVKTAGANPISLQIDDLN